MHVARSLSVELLLLRIYRHGGCHGEAGRHSEGGAQGSGGGSEGQSGERPAAVQGHSLMGRHALTSDTVFVHLLLNS